MAYLATYGMACLLGIPRNPTMCYTITMAELLGPMLPVGLFLNQEDSRRRLIESVKHIVNNRLCYKGYQELQIDSLGSKMSKTEHI